MSSPSKPGRQGQLSKAIPAELKMFTVAPSSTPQTGSVPKTGTASTTGTVSKIGSVPTLASTSVLRSKIQSSTRRVPVPAVTRSSYRSKSPVAVADLLSSALNAPQLKAKAKQYAMFPHWPEIVGERIAASAVPEKLVRGNVLCLRVLDAAWAQELTMMKEEILEKIRKFTAGGGIVNGNRPVGAVIEDITFITGSPKAARKR